MRAELRTLRWITSASTMRGPSGRLAAAPLSMGSRFCALHLQLFVASPPVVGDCDVMVFYARRFAHESAALGFRVFGLHRRPCAGRSGSVRRGCSYQGCGVLVRCLARRALLDFETTGLDLSRGRWVIRSSCPSVLCDCVCWPWQVVR